MEREDLIGKKIKGFKFDGNKYKDLPYKSLMNTFIGKVGEIISYSKRYDSFIVDFNAGIKWSYPASQI